MKKVTVNGTVTSHRRFIYRDYLPICCLDMSAGNLPAMWFLTWDPAEPVATRPLAIRKDGTWYCYGLDITKNVWELFGHDGAIRTTYDYAPYGAVTEEGEVTQSIQWSSEVYDDELALVYYNYRHYNPMDGRWISRDPIGEQGGMNPYNTVQNKVIKINDYLGLSYYPYAPGAMNLPSTYDSPIYWRLHYLRLIALQMLFNTFDHIKGEDYLPGNDSLIKSRIAMDLKKIEKRQLTE